MRITDGLTADQAQKILDMAEIRIFKDRLDGIQELTDNECGIILRWLVAYCNGCDVEPPQDRLIRVIVNGVKNGIDFNVKKTLETSWKAKESRKGNSTKGTKNSFTDFPQSDIVYKALEKRCFVN